MNSSIDRKRCEARTRVSVINYLSGEWLLGAEITGAGGVV